MANNRLYIYDPEANEAFMLAKSSGGGWYPFLRSKNGDSEGPDGWLKRLDAWLDMRDVEASSGNPDDMKSTTLKVVTEYDLPNDCKTNS